MSWRSRAVTASIGEVGRRFCGNTKERRGLHPSHWENEWDGDKLFFVRSFGENDGQAWGLIGVKSHSVETISNVDFQHVYGPIGRIGVSSFGKETIQCATKLHGLGWRMRDGFCVNVVKTQIDN
jgi:hypothetical protein